MLTKKRRLKKKLLAEGIQPVSASHDFPLSRLCSLED